MFLGYDKNSLSDSIKRFFCFPISSLLQKLLSICEDRKLKDDISKAIAIMEEKNRRFDILNDKKDDIKTYIEDLQKYITKLEEEIFICRNKHIEIIKSKENYEDLLFRILKLYRNKQMEQLELLLMELRDELLSKNGAYN
jgi:hypothetical protein